jgi:L-threonylcarbamoyladenylate synthase
MPISLAVSSYMEIEPLVAWGPAARSLARRWLPGAVTLLVRASPAARRRLAPPLVGPDGTVGLRIPDHPVARELARRVGPITCTSANRHGEPPVPSVAAARRAFGSDVAYYLAGDPAPSGKPSLLLDLRGDAPRWVKR